VFIAPLTLRRSCAYAFWGNFFKTTTTKRKTSVFLKGAITTKSNIS
jgi:hypothetical protein